MDKYAISVIVPCYNVQDYIAETLQSLFEQTFQDFEIICLDDGSTDDTLAILEKFADSRENMTVVRETNHRQGYERNQGAGMSSGTYIYYMDSDDLLVPECFQTIYEICETNKLDLIFFEGNSFYEIAELEEQFSDYKTLYHRKGSYSQIYTGQELYVRFRKNGDLIVSPCMQMIRRKFLEEHKLRFPELPLLEDNLYVFWCLMEAKRAFCIKDRLYLRRIRESSTMTSVNMEEKQYSLRMIWQELVSSAADYRENDELYHAILDHALAIVRQMSLAGEERGSDINIWKDRAISITEELSLLLTLDAKLQRSHYASQYFKGQIFGLQEENGKLHNELSIVLEKEAEKDLQIKKLKTRIKKLRQSKEEQLRQSEKALEKKENQVVQLKERVEQKNKELKELRERFLVKVSCKCKDLIARGRKTDVRMYYYNYPNVGDLLNVMLLEDFFHIKVFEETHARAELMAIGSVLDRLLAPGKNSKILTEMNQEADKKHAIDIWGTGFMYDYQDGQEFVRPIKIHALRGKFSADIVSRIQGKPCDCVLADPGLLASKLLKEKWSKNMRSELFLTMLMDKSQ